MKSSEELAKEYVFHDYYDDNWYSCPLATEGCSDDSKDKTKCYCGADELRIKLAKAFDQVHDEAVEECARISEKYFCEEDECAVYRHAASAMRKLKRVSIAQATLEHRKVFMK